MPHGPVWTVRVALSASAAEGAFNMSPNLSLLYDGKKFLWDGSLYATREEVSPVEEAYRKNNFEVRVTEEEGKFLIYTRKVIKEVVVAAH